MVQDTGGVDAPVLSTVTKGQRVMNKTNARVLIADDHAVVRAGMRQFLEADAAVAAVGEASSGAETLTRLREQPWDLLVLDLNMPDRSGLDILRHVRATHPDVPILVVSGFPEKQYAVNVLRAGASGYLAKDQPAEDFLRAVHTVLNGRRFISSAVAEILVGDLDRPGERPLHSDLSQREFQTLCKLAVGRSVSDIANELCISVKTVSTYRSRLLEKMGMRNNADITAYALRNSLIQ
jgi:two-component system, NarL family, invasion response regulator UvrY